MLKVKLKCFQIIDYSLLDYYGIDEKEINVKKLMFKGIHFTDTHYTHRNPKNRKDIMLAAAIEKTIEVANIAKENDVDFIIHTGDFFDTASVSDGVAGFVGKVYQREFHKKVIVLPGGHDLRHNNMVTLDETKLGLLGKLDIVEIVDAEKKILFEKDGFTLQISGVPSETLISQTKEKSILNESDKTADFAINLLHAMVLKENANAGSYIPLTEIQSVTHANATLIGHFHLGFDHYEFDDQEMGFKKYFVNPGALVRKYNFISEIERTPQVALLEIYDDLSMDVTYIPLKTVRPGEEVLDREKMLEAKEYEAKLDEFANGITSFVDGDKEFDLSMNIENIFKRICEEIDDVQEQLEIMKIGLRFIEDAKKTLKLI